MKLKKLGIEWGAAFEEAQPHRITAADGETTVEVFQTETGDIAFEFTNNFLVQHTRDGKLRVVVIL